MLKDKYDRILEQFKSYYPGLYESSVDWWPSGRSFITVKNKDGSRVEFNAFDNSIRRIKESVEMDDVETLRKEIGYNIYKTVVARGIGQNTIAERVGITEAMLSRYIHGTSMPGIDKLYKIARSLGCELSDLLPETTNK